MINRNLYRRCYDNRPPNDSQLDLHCCDHLTNVTLICFVLRILIWLLM